MMKQITKRNLQNAQNGRNKTAHPARQPFNFKANPIFSVAYVSPLSRHKKDRTTVFSLLGSFASFNRMFHEGEIRSFFTDFSNNAVISAWSVALFSSTILTHLYPNRCHILRASGGTFFQKVPLARPSASPYRDRQDCSFSSALSPFWRRRQRCASPERTIRSCGSLAETALQRSTSRDTG